RRTASCGSRRGWPGGRGSYAAGVARPGERPWPSTAEALMRSRFEAFRDGDREWLLASWHVSTRPPSLDLLGNPEWLDLLIVDRVDGGPLHRSGIVEFQATYRSASGDLGVLHERSRFVREDGRWYYLDAVT